MPEAPLSDSGSGLAPAGDGWFVVNVRDAEWLTSENGDKRPSGAECAFEGQIGQAAYSASKGGVVGMTLPIARTRSSQFDCCLLSCRRPAAVSR